MGAPVILCGRTEAIGSGVIADLKPEFDGPWLPLARQTKPELTEAAQ
jgi:hypothetical protein